MHRIRIRTETRLDIIEEMAVSGATLRALAFVLLTGVLAVVVIATLLLFGVEPHLVFTPGFAVRSWGEKLGIHVPKPVGVLTTVLSFWIAIVAVWLTVARVVRRGDPARP
jgi:hypothetical protein